MAAPDGYEKLGRIGFVYKGNYSASSTYKTSDVVYHNGSTWVALKDNLKGVAPAEGENWKCMAKGFLEELLSGIKALDNSGLLGATGGQVSAQSLIDAIADKVATKLLLKTDVVNQIVNDATKAASMAALYSVKQTVDQLNGNISKIEDSSRTPVKDLFEEANVGRNHRRFVECGSNTLNTPYKKGLITKAVGAAIIESNSVDYATIIYIPSGDTRIFIIAKAVGTWGEWKELSLK